MSKKPIIVFEGVEGCGKSFHLKNIANYLKKKKKTIIKIKKQKKNKKSE